MKLKRYEVRCVTCPAITKLPSACGWVCADNGWECPKCCDKRNAKQLFTSRYSWGQVLGPR